MRLSRWLGLLALLVGVGTLRVAQQTMVCLKGYAVGERLRHLHEGEVALALLDAEVIGLRSPAHLADAARERQLTLVAWSRIDRAAAATPAAGAAPARPAQLAALEPADDSAD